MLRKESKIDNNCITAIDAMVTFVVLRGFYYHVEGWFRVSSKKASYRYLTCGLYNNSTVPCWPACCAGSLRFTCMDVHIATESNHANVLV